VSGPRQLCTFFLRGHRLAVQADRVREVVRHTGATPVPLAPRGAVGLVNLRGEIVTAIDLAARLGWKQRTEDEETFGVVFDSEQGKVSLLVDRVGDVIHVEESSIDPAPDTLAESVRGTIVGACKLPGELVLLLDVERAIPGAEDSPV
jgi:purine-binding chemotaxis protein CheW